MVTPSGQASLHSLLCRNLLAAQAVHVVTVPEHSVQLESQGSQTPNTSIVVLAGHALMQVLLLSRNPETQVKHLLV